MIQQERSNEDRLKKERARSVSENETVKEKQRNISPHNFSLLEPKCK